MAEYLCPTCGERIESLEDRSAVRPSIAHCSTSAPRVISAPRVKAGIQISVERARYEGPPHRDAVDTRGLADGESMQSFKTKRAKVHDQKRRNWIKKHLS